MSEVSANTPKRQAIVERLKQRIDSFRKHHDDCQTRLERAQPSRELKQRQESHLLHSKFMENKAKTNAKLRHEQVNKIAKQEGISGVGQEKSTSNTGLQSTMKRRNEFSPSQIDGEINLQSNDELGQAVAQKYPRFEGRNGVHCNTNPNYSAAGDRDTLALHNSLSFPTVNGHNGEFPTKSEEQTIPVSSFNSSTCETVDRTTTRSSQQYPNDFASSTTFPSTGQTNPADNSITTDIIPVNFKKETDLVSPGNNETSTSIPSINANGFSEECTTKSEENFESLLTTDYGNPYSTDDDLKSQISEFERVFQVIKNQDRNSSECDTKSEIPSTNIGVNKLAVQNTAPLSNELPDSVVHDVAKSNQLALSNGPNNTNQLATVAVTPSTHQQHATISRSTAQAVHQFIRAQQEERLTKVRFEKNYLLTSQGVTRDQNTVRMPQRPSHFPAIRQRVYEQIQQRRTNQQKTKIHGLPGAQMQARNPVMNPMGASSPYQMHGSVRYANMVSTATQQTFVPKGRLQQNIMPPMHHTAAIPQAAQGQMQSMPRHQMNMYVEQQKMAFQQQIASRLPSYSQAQHTSMMDMQQKLSAGTSHYPLHQQVSRSPQPLSHLQHYPNTYSNQGTVPTTSRPIQNTFTPEYNTYPYGYGNNQDKIPIPYQRHSSMDESLTTNRYLNQDINNRNNFNFQRSSSVPAHNTGANNVFNQTSPPVVRLGQTKANLPDMNNNGSEHQNQGMHPTSQHPPLTHMKHEHPTNSLSVSQEHYQGNNFLSQSRPATNTNLQPTFSNSFTNLLDLKSNSESSLFPFLGQDVNAGCNENTDFDSLLKSPPADFNLLNLLENETQKSL